MKSRVAPPIAGTRPIRDKLSHLDAALSSAAETPTKLRPGGSLTFDQLRFLPATLPETNLRDIDLSITFLGKRLDAPLMISPMTGGMRRGANLNRRMAAAAERAKIAFGVGSQRVALESPRRAAAFRVRQVAPTTVLFANLGAVQLVKGYTADDAERAVEMIQADALFLHLNSMQEVVQVGGDTDWRGVLCAIGKVCDRFARQRGVPVFAREVGFGIPRDQARLLLDAGVSGIDCSGAGGTSWTLVEGLMAETHQPQVLGRTFADWGLTTAESILEVRAATRTAPLIASGGVRNGLDVAKALALGATIVGMAAPVLRAAAVGERALTDLLECTIAELRAVCFGVGASNLATFQLTPRLLRTPRWA